MDIWHFYNNKEDMRCLLSKIEDIIHKEPNIKILDLFYDWNDDEYTLILEEQ